MDLSVNIAGLKWRTPLAISAGPLTRNAQEIWLAAQHTGVGAVFTKTIYYKERETPKPTMVKVRGGLVNYDWSGSSLSTWEEYLAELKGLPIPIIASMVDNSPEVMVEMAQRLEAAGAQGLEVPLNTKLSLTEMAERVERLKEAVKIPLICKVGSTLPDTRRYAQALVEAGADALSGINTLGPCLVLDKEGYPFLGNSYGYGYLSGPAIKGVALRTVAELASAVKVPVIGGGGIMSVQDAVDFLSMGASAFFLHTAVILKGWEIADALVKDLAAYCTNRGFSSLRELRGRALAQWTAEPRLETKIPRINRELCNACGLCVKSCIYHSLSLEGKMWQQDKSKCFGCGLCVSLCPRGALTI